MCIQGYCLKKNLEGTYSLSLAVGSTVSLVVESIIIATTASVLEFLALAQIPVISILDGLATTVANIRIKKALS